MLPAKITKDRRVSQTKITKLLGTVAGVALLAGPAHAEWTITPYAGVSAHYTDNVGLNSAEESDFVTSIGGGVEVVNTSARQQTTLSAGIAYDKYADFDQFDGYRIGVLGATNINIIENRFDIDARLSISEREISRSSATSARTRSINNNRTRVTTYSVTPKFVQQFSDEVQGSVSVSVSGNNFDDTDVGTNVGEPDDEVTTTARVALGTIPEAPGIRWNILGRYTENDEDFKRSTIEGYLHVPVGKKLTPYIHIGHDDFEQPGLDEDERSGEFYAIGVNYTPGPRLTIDAEIGDRYGGTSGLAAITYLVNDNLNISVRYDESVQTQQQNLQNRLNNLAFSDTGTLVDQLGGAPNVSAVELDLLSAVFKTERISAGINGQIGRNEIAANAFHSTREFDALNRDEVVTGATFNIQRPLSDRTTAYVGAGYSETLASRVVGNDDKDIRFSAGVNMDINPTLVATFAYDYRNRERTISGISLSDISENVLSAILRKTF